MFVFVFAKKLTRISLSNVLIPGPSNNTKLAYCNNCRKLEGFVWEKQLSPPSHASVVFHTTPCKFWNFLTVVKSFLYTFKGWKCLLWIKRRFEPRNTQGNISRQFENEIYKDLYAKPLKHDWVAKVVFLIEILLISAAMQWLLLRYTAENLILICSFSSC